MKCQRKASPYAACLRSRSWARFSPTTSTPAAARRPMSSSATYFVAATIVTAGPTSARIRSRFARTASGDTGDHSLDTPWLPGPAVREEALGVAERADVGAEHVVDPGRIQRALGSAPEVERAAADDVGPERRCERLRDL